MTISLNWLKNYLDIDLPPQEISDLLTSIGLEVEAMEEVETIKGGLEGVFTGEVVECWKHPNADKLSLTRVNIGKGELLQIVCGAPNVTKGQKVLVATVGTTLYPLGGEPFTLKKGKIRGEESQGMICAEDELGLGEDHSGIMVLPPETPVGLKAAEYLQVEKDVIFEVGLTPNRSDATSHVGVARDLAAVLNVRLNKKVQVKMPTFVLPNKSARLLPITVRVENHEACPRYAGICLRDVTVKESPEWLKRRLLSIGQRPINNIVDVTNFVLHELGQPLHAFDYEKINNAEITVKTLPAGTDFLSLDGQHRKLTDTDLMICDGQSLPMCMGGIFGGIHSGVSEDTRHIFLESAHFHPRWIRQSSTRHDLRTSAAKIFEKGSDPNICLFALQRAAALILEIAGGEPASDIIDVYPKPIEPRKIKITYDYIHRLSGMKFTVGQIEAILLALEMQISEKNARSITVAVPTNKADVVRPADILEEVLRIYGLDNVPVPQHIRSSLVHSEYPEPELVQNTIGDFLAALGFHEIISLSLSQSVYYNNMPQWSMDQVVFINNTSNTQLDIMRPTMLFSGLEAVLHNHNRQQNDLKLFEFGKTYRRIAHQPDAGVKTFSEPRHLALFMCGQRWTDNWRFNSKPTPQSDFFTIKAIVNAILNRLGVEGCQENPDGGDSHPSSPLTPAPFFSYSLLIHRGNQAIARLGKVSPSIGRKMGIKKPVFYADLNWDAILTAVKKKSINFAELNKFPSVRRDLAVIIGKSVKYTDITALARKTCRKLLKEIVLFDVFDDESKIGKGLVSYAMGFTFEDPTRTLQDKDIENAINDIIIAFESKLGATIRR